MAAERIQKDDLVVVIKACCAAGEVDLGYIFIASEQQSFSGTCCDCGAVLHSSFVKHPSGELDSWIPVEFLKRIPPLDELEHTEIVTEALA